MASITEVGNGLAQPMLLAGQVLESLYETVVPNVEASLEKVETQLQDISAKLEDSVAALHAIVVDSEPDAKKKRTAYCNVVLKVEDPHTLENQYTALLEEVCWRRQQWKGMKSEPAYGRIGATRALAENLKQLQDRCIELKYEATETSSRIRKQGAPQPNVKHTPL